MVVVPFVADALDWYLDGGVAVSDVGPPTRWAGLLDGDPHVVGCLGDTPQRLRARIFRHCQARGVSVRVGYRRFEDGEEALLIQRVQILAVISRTPDV